MRWVLALMLMLAACDDGDNERFQPVAQPGSAQQCTELEIGPTIPADEKHHAAAQNFSINMPLHPTKDADGCAFSFGPDSEPHYITKATGPLLGKTKITLRYRVEGAPETVIYPKDMSGLPSQLALYFQRCGEIRFDKEGFRWYSDARHAPITIGTHELSVPLKGVWGSVYQATSYGNPPEFLASLQDTCRVGFVVGGGKSGVGHGVRATAPVKFIITAFEVE